MPRLPTLSGRQVVRIFERFGWQVEGTLARRVGQSCTRATEPQLKENRYDSHQRHL